MAALRSDITTDYTLCWEVETELEPTVSYFACDGRSTHVHPAITARPCTCE